MARPRQSSDLIDRFPRYVLDVDMSKWEALVTSFFRENVLSQSVPHGGYVVELGTARAINFSALCNQFGQDRCIGIDIVNYGHHARVLELDARDLSSKHDLPISLGWNDLADWKSSPASKRAGFEYLKRNVIRNGFLADAAFASDTLRSLDLSDFEIVAEANVFKLFRRVTGGPTPLADDSYGASCPTAFRALGD